MIENTVESLTKRLKESEKKLKELRNLKLETESKILVENAWLRYIRDQIEVLKKVESTSSVLSNTED
jgi:hypothetical protein